MMFLKPLAPIAAGLAIASTSSYLGYAAASHFLPQPADRSAQPPATLVTAPAPGQTLTLAATPELPAEITIETTPAAPANRVTVQIFRPDPTCETLIAEAIAVPAEAALDTAVQRTLAQGLGPDFPLAGYRIHQEQAVASVELRLPPEAKRTFQSLSPCEQFTLFGSLRATLTENDAWQIDDVRFTQQGEELYL